MPGTLSVLCCCKDGRGRGKSSLGGGPIQAWEQRTSTPVMVMGPLKVSLFSLRNEHVCTFAVLYPSAFSAGASIVPVLSRIIRDQELYDGEQLQNQMKIILTQDLLRRKIIGWKVPLLCWECVVTMVCDASIYPSRKVPSHIKGCDQHVGNRRPLFKCDNRPTQTNMSFWRFSTPKLTAKTIFSLKP